MPPREPCATRVSDLDKAHRSASCSAAHSHSTTKTCARPTGSYTPSSTWYRRSLGSRSLRSSTLAIDKSATRDRCKGCLALPVTFVPDPPPLGLSPWPADAQLVRLAAALMAPKAPFGSCSRRGPFHLRRAPVRRSHVITLQSCFAIRLGPLGAGVRHFGIGSPTVRSRAWERQYIPRIRNLLAVNNTIASYVRQQAPAVRVFPTTNTAAEDFFLTQSTETGPSVLCVSQISQRKGLHHLLAAFAHVAAAVPGSQCRIVGAEIQDPHMQRICARCIQI